MLNSLSVQWHITADCTNKCKHCYMFDENEYQKIKASELSDEKLYEIFQSIKDFEKKWNAEINYFSITGGDPLLRKNWDKFIKLLRDNNKTVSIMGNPETLTEKNLKKLVDLGITRYQLSLDGLEKTHDYIRGKGSFQRTLEGIEKLYKHNIKSNIMFTLNSANKDDLIPLLNFVALKTSASSFTFDIMSSVGNAKTELSGELDADTIYSIFENYLETKKILNLKNNKIRINEKPQLFKILSILKGKEYYDNVDELTNISGCLIGWTCTCILSDGTVLACRRFPLKVGKMPEQSFEDIFLGSKELRKFRRPEYYEECGNCEFYKLCRGCPAVVYGMTGNPFAKNPLCFKDKIKSTKKIKKSKPRSLSIDATYEEEYNFIHNKAVTKYSNDLKKLLKNKYIKKALLKTSDKNELQKFIDNPEKFCYDNQLKLNNYELFFVGQWKKFIHINIQKKIINSLFWEQLN